MKFFTTFLVSLAANTVAYCICKWLERYLK